MKDSKIILVPTFRRKPLRLKHSYKSHWTKSKPATQDDLFLYFTLTSNPKHGLCARENVPEDVSFGCEAERRSYRFSTEVHPDNMLDEPVDSSDLPSDLKLLLQ